jgi:hypothetical protein
MKGRALTRTALFLWPTVQTRALGAGKPALGHAERQS